MQADSDDQAQLQERQSAAPGKRLLIEAALRLTSISRSLSNLGLRELAREAGLNPNTFYRHFKDIDDLGLTVIREVASQLRQPLREMRRQAAMRVVQPRASEAASFLGIDLALSRQVCHETVELFFDFVGENPAAFIIGVRELHGSSPLLRAALDEVMDQFGADMAEDTVAFKLLPDSIEPPAVLQLCTLISRNLFQLSMDYIGQPERRGAVRALAEEQVMLLLTGACVLHSVAQLKLPAR